jgi:hypothetical protein
MIRSLYSALVWLVLLPVHVYRAAISPLKRGPSCRFLPTCSEYAITAVKERGIVVGGALESAGGWAGATAGAAAFAAWFAPGDAAGP